MWLKHALFLTTPHKFLQAFGKFAESQKSSTLRASVLSRYSVICSMLISEPLLNFVAAASRVRSFTTLKTVDLFSRLSHDRNSNS